MLRLRDIMTTDVITVDPNITIREAMDVLVSKRITGAPVVAGGEVVGVISATDLLQFSAALPGVPTERELAPDLYDDADVADAEILADPDDDPAGLYFTELWDDVGGTVVERMAVPITAEWNSLEEHTVSEAMTRTPVHALSPDTLVTLAADYLRRTKIHRVLVMNGRELLGVVTTSDITDAVADGKLTARTYVFERRDPAMVRSTWGRRR
jgi:CBS domain-containing protein